MADNSLKVYALNDQTSQTDATPQPTTDLNGWLAIADVLANRFAKQYNRSEASIKLARILAENGGQSLLAETIASALAKDVTYIEFRDLSKLKRKFPILVLSQSATPFLITATAARNSYAVTGADDSNQIIDVIVPAQDIDVPSRMIT